MRSNFRALSLLLLSSSFFPGGGIFQSQARALIIPVSTPMPVQLVDHVPMKVGESLEGRLLYPVYEGNQVAIPAGCLLQGHVVRLNPYGAGLSFYNRWLARGQEVVLMKDTRIEINTTPTRHSLSPAGLQSH